jgi:hypothetical protein
MVTKKYLSILHWVHSVCEAGKFARKIRLCFSAWLGEEDKIIISKKNNIDNELKW